MSILVCAMMALVRADENNGTIHLVDLHKSTAISSNCQENWEEFMGRCYHFVPRSLTWIEAEKNCLSLKSNLASIHSLEEYQFIQRRVQEGSQDEAVTWVGGSNCQENSVWLWTDGTPFSFEKWCPDEPNNVGGVEHCLHMNARDQHCWNDKQCSDKYPSVCSTKF